MRRGQEAEGPAGPSLPLPRERVDSPVRRLRAAGVRHLSEPGAVDVHGVDVRVDVAVLALGEGDLRSVRRPAWAKAAIGRWIGVRAAARRTRLHVHLVKP